MSRDDDYQLPGSSPAASDLTRAIVLLNEAVDQLSYIHNEEVSEAFLILQQVVDLMERFYQVYYDEFEDSDGEYIEFTFDEEEDD